MQFWSFYRALSLFLALGAVAAAQIGNTADRAQCEALLRQAIVKNGNDADALLRLGSLLEKAFSASIPDLDSQVEPLYQRAITVREQAAVADPSDLALALELKARLLDKLGRTETASGLRTRAVILRRKIVETLYPPLNSNEIAYRTGQLALVAPRLTSHPEPPYTEWGRLAHVPGTVLLEFIIGSDGVPHSIRLLQSLGFGLDEAAAAALANWRFLPATLKGDTVPVQSKVEMTFRLL